MVIDFHTHCFADKIAENAISALTKNNPNEGPYLNGTIKNLQASAEKAGIDYNVIASIATKPSQFKVISDWSIEIKNERRIIPFGSIHPENKDFKDELKRLHAAGIKGIKMHHDYQNSFVDDEKLYPIYEEISNLGFVILFHAGLDIGLPEPVHCPPARLIKVVKDFPDLIIVAAHLGGDDVSYDDNKYNDVTKYLAGKAPNLYFDTSYTLKYMPAEKGLKLIRSLGTDKVLFGTDSPWTDQLEEVERIKNIGLNKNELDMILYQNAAKLLKL